MPSGTWGADRICSPRCTPAMPTSSPPRSPDAGMLITVNGNSSDPDPERASVLSGTTGSRPLSRSPEGVGGSYRTAPRQFSVSSGGELTLSERLHWRGLAGNNTTGTMTFTANAPQLERRLISAVCRLQSTNRQLPQGSSSDEPLTVITVTPTSTYRSSAAPDYSAALAHPRQL